MTTKILTALAALSLFTAASARTLEQYLDPGSEGSGGMTAQASPFQVTFNAALSYRPPAGQLTASNADLVFQARAPRTFRTLLSVQANTLTVQLQANTEVLWQARRPMKLSSKSM